MLSFFMISSRRFDSKFGGRPFRIYWITTPLPTRLQFADRSTAGPFLRRYLFSIYSGKLDDWGAWRSRNTIAGNGVNHT
jgi:hypothetical protein